MNRVLLIEDDVVTRRLLAELFRYEDFEVAEAESGQAGIDAAAAVTPDVVVCDIMMPGTDGFAVLDSLRQRPDMALTPFIFLTAKAGGVDVRTGMARGADDYITKPFDPDSLLASVRQRLKHRSLQLEEAERRAMGTSMQAAAALPREMQGCLAHLERISDYFTARYGGDNQAHKMSTAMKDEVARLRAMSERLRLYSELPGLYARRFSSLEQVDSCSASAAHDAAERVARTWTRTHDLHVDLADAAVPLATESLSLLATELVDNAFKFSETGTPVHLRGGLERACWQMSVSDRGAGLTSEQVREIGAFKQFWNGQNRPPGLGLGLVLVQSVARLHSGEVVIDSAPGAGTTVTVMIPSESL